MELVSTSFKVSDFFSAKDKTPHSLKFFVVSKLIYIGETCSYFKEVPKLPKIIFSSDAKIDKNTNNVLNCYF